jgi:bacterioferritin-associated ferredoxin
MIICSCKAVSDRTIAEIIAEGFSYREMIKMTEVGTCCGKCSSYVKQLVVHKKVKPMSDKEMFAQDYIMHGMIVAAENVLKDAGWKVESMTHYDDTAPLKIDWGVRYMKADKVVWLNRFTAETIVNMFGN